VINEGEMNRFLKLRQLTLDAVGRALKRDGHCKSYEGTFEIVVCYPNYFEERLDNLGELVYIITLHCYVLGPGRHYDWRGKAFKEALKKAEKDLYKWIAEEDAWDVGED